MSRRPAFFGFLIAFSVALSQFSTAQTNTGYVQSGVPAVSGPTIFVGQGPSTPTTTFAAPAPTAGISDAGRAGISNQTPTVPVLPASTDTVVYYTQPGVQTIVTSPSAPGFVAPVTGVVENPAPVETAPEGTEANPEGTPPQQGAADQSSRNDLVPAQFANTVPNGSGVSLAEISARFKADKSMHNARLLTNEDALRLKQGNSDITVARNMPPANPGEAAPENAPLQNAPQSQSSASAPNTSAQNAQNNATANNDQQTSANQGQSSSDATTPAINQNQQNNDNSGSGSLPATATFLPLFGILGLASGGLGMWFRKFRR